MELTTLENKTLLFLFYLVKLEEGGFVENIPYVITESGFEVAMQLIEKGVVLTPDELEMFCLSQNIDIKFVTLLEEVQRIGLPAMLEMMNESNNEE